MTLVALVLLAIAQDPSLVEYLKAAEKEERPALAAAVKVFKGNFRQALDAVRAVGPLSPVTAGVHHDLKFKSGSMEWDYSIRLPKGYDGVKKFPVLVLPDHALAGKTAVSFWEQDPENSEKVICFRPLIIKHQEDLTRFPDQKPLVRDPAMAAVMRDALTHLRLHYAVDEDRVSMTGLSQAGFYTWYYGISFPDQFAGLVPESSGGTVVPLFIAPFAANLKSVPVKILHTQGDKITPYQHAELMLGLLQKAGGKAELVTFTAADYRRPSENLHPVPMEMRLKHVLSWALGQKREMPPSFTRHLRYPQQGVEGRFRILSPFDWQKPRTVTCSEEKGELSVQGADAVYLVAPDHLLEGRQFVVNKKKIKPKPDIELLLRSFKSTGDLRRLAAAEIPLK